LQLDTTIIYYTANTEDPVLESKVRSIILKNKGDLPIISVSRKPIDFGENICVGETVVCDISAFKQLLIGLKSATTKFCIAAEADVLYPPEYFNFTPPTDQDAYRYNNVWLFSSWVSRGNQNKFWKKDFSEGAQTAGREYWIERLQIGIKMNHGKFTFPTKDHFFWNSDNPVVTIKTGMGLRSLTGHLKISMDKLPMWGSTNELRSEIWGTK